MAIFAWLLLSMLNFELSRNRFEFFVPRFLKLASPKQNGSRRCAPSRSPAPPSGAGVGRLPSGERSPRSHGPPSMPRLSLRPERREPSTATAGCAGARGQARGADSSRGHSGQCTFLGFREHKASTSARRGS
jgi:hypothetical protein